MKILFYDTKEYDRKYFQEYLPEYPELEIEYTQAELQTQTAALAEGCEAVCAFVNTDISREVLKRMSELRIHLILLRCAGFNQVDLKAAGEFQITVMHVPGYSPQAVAEHAMALTLTACRRIHKAYNRVRENDFSLHGLEGVNLYGKTAGIIGTGKIGAAMARICHGFGMEVLAYDVYPNKELNFATYVSINQLLRDSDLISLHCPLTEATHHLIHAGTIERMKDGVILINTSRGGLIKTEDLVEGIRAHKFFAVGLDVYEEEKKYVYEDYSSAILSHSTTARLLSFPNVVITSHQGFFTKEALTAICRTTLENARCYAQGKKSGNELA